jgi:S1-C subfamily serine protease
MVALICSVCYANAASLYVGCRDATFKIICVDDGEEVGYGSGFYIRSDGYALTCYHVVERCHPVVERGGNRFSTNIVDMDIENDLALIWSSEQNTPYLKIRKTSVNVGEEAYTFGFPLGMPLIGEGIVSGFMDGYIMTSSPISPGSSGGALLDENGEVIGITRATYVNGQLVNEAISSEVILRFLKW